MLAEGRVYADARGNIVAEDDPKAALVVASRKGKPIPKEYEAAYKTYLTKQTPPNEPVTKAATTPEPEKEREEKPDPGPAREVKREEPRRAGRK